MRIAAATAVPCQLPLTLAGPTTRSVALLCLRTDDGRSGFGECAPLPSHGSESDDEALRALDAACRRLPGNAVGALLDALAGDAAADAAPAARSAVETALIDLAAQAAGQPLWRWLAGPQQHAGEARRPAVNALAGDLASLTPERIGKLVDAGFEVIKLKLGRAAPDSELAALRRLRPLLPPAVRLRLDANRAWDRRTAARMCAALAELPVDMLEEPLALPVAAALPELAALQRDLPFPLALDEGWGELQGAENRRLREDFLAAPPVRRLVLKLAVHGGPLAARAAARTAAAAGVGCVVTTGIDGACATLAAAHLAAALDDGLAHGLATSSWLAADLGAPPRIAGGRLILPDADGLGFVPATPAASFPSRR